MECCHVSFRHPTSQHDSEPGVRRRGIFYENFSVQLIIETYMSLPTLLLFVALLALAKAARLLRQGIGPEDVFFFDTPVCSGIVSNTFCHKCVESDGSDAADPVPFGIGIDVDSEGGLYWACKCRDPDGSDRECFIYKLSDEEVSLMVEQYGPLAGLNLLQEIPIVNLPPAMQV